MDNCLILGEFNAEKYWKDNRFSKLPEFFDKDSENIILAMDEMLFSFSNNSSNNILLTRFKFNEILKNYLIKFGYEFQVNAHDIQNTEEETDLSIFQIVNKKGNIAQTLQESIRKCQDVELYSAIPQVELFSQKFGLNVKIPDVQTIKMVNSKIYSCKLSHKFGLKYAGYIVNSHQELLDYGKKMLKDSSIIIKDPYGVSGKGSILVNSALLLDRIAKYLAKQEKNGCISSFVVEQFLEREIDFSCHFTIGILGEVTIKTVQKIVNNQLAYLGSYPADDNFLRYLDQGDYFRIVEKIAQELYQDGYFGPVCLDSMVLKNNEIVPIVEINARKSMGLISYNINERLKAFNVKGSLMVINFSYNFSNCQENNITFAQILAKLETENLCYQPGLASGIMPISANTLFINSYLATKFPNKTIVKNNQFKGRIYVVSVANKLGERNELVEKFKVLLESFKLKVF